MVIEHGENAVIRVIGLGGGGNNAVNRMIETGMQGVEFIAANTDAQVLATSLADVRIQIGDFLTRGLGAGANPNIGEKAAIENRDQIAESLEGSDLVFITAGMGGGTGTGSSPIVAEVARDLGALTIAVVTTPFLFEGSTRRRHAREGLDKLRDKVDALIVVENQRLLGTLDRSTGIDDAFLAADRVLYHGVRGISDVINVPGIINVDFADVRTLLKEAGTVLMGIGTGRGERRVEEAARSAIESPLLERGVKGAHQLLVNITSSRNQLSLFEANEIVAKITDATEVDDVDVFFGVTHDPDAADEIRVTMIATGFDRKDGPRVVRPGLPIPKSNRTYDPSDLSIPSILRQKIDETDE